MKNSAVTNNSLRWLIALAVVVGGLGLFSPVLNSNDAYFYAVISKTLVTSHNWVDLYYAGQDWLDKPHLPFWLTAFSFKLFGVSAFAYVLPGFIFNLIGALYTYKLAKLFYDETTGLVAALIYVTSLHLMLSAMDVRAEAYLLGEIMPACYYWLIYDRSSQIKALLLASLFTGLALMTKGLFVVITIFSGLVASWIYARHYWRIISPKWLLAYGLSLAWALPEFVCLYLQFDAHPEKIVFGHTQVSGLAWFFWGSQFGRFFNSGPIVNTHGNPFFFVHTFLWAFLPWSLVFILALYTSLRNFKQQIADKQSVLIYLQFSFWLTFILFSATKFQLDHYTNIIMPFAAILCANYLLTQVNLRNLARFQLSIAILLSVLTLGLIAFIFKFSYYSLFAFLPLLLVVGIIQRSNHHSPLQRCLIWPSLAINYAFIFVMLVNGVIYQRYDVGYNVAQTLNSVPNKLPIYVLGLNGMVNNLDFQSNHPVYPINSLTEIQAKNYYLLVADNFALNLPTPAEKIADYNGIEMMKFIPSLLSKKNYQNSIQHDTLYLVINAH